MTIKAVGFEGVVVVTQPNDRDLLHYHLIERLSDLLVSRGRFPTRAAAEDALDRWTDNPAKINFGYVIEGRFFDYDLMPVADQSGVADAMKVWERQDA